MGWKRSPLRFTGSKFQALKYLLPICESMDCDEYREPFFGGGAVFFAKEKSNYNWINDISPELINFYEVISEPELREQLIKDLEKENLPTKERHKEVKFSCPTSKKDRAFKYFYLNRTSYGGIMKKPAWGFHPTKSVPPEKWGERIRTAGRKLENCRITCVDYEHVINSPRKGKRVFYFLDPPYFNADQKRAYENSFEKSEHFRLFRILKELNDPFILTYDDCSEIRDLYAWAYIYEVSWRYHTSNSNKASRKMGRELIITNFQVGSFSYSKDKNKNLDIFFDEQN